LSSEATNLGDDAQKARDGTPAIPEVIDTDPVYASDVRIAADPGGVQLIFTRFRPRMANVDEPEESLDADLSQSEIIARIVLPPLAAERLLRLLPDRLIAQQDLAREYARRTGRQATSGNATGQPQTALEDPLVEALRAAALDDEPFTDEDRAAARAGWDAFQRGESASWEEVRRALLDEEDTPLVSTP
jgi:hypothetical protein